jgi:DNA-binding SARP family transcriptional activator
MLKAELFGTGRARFYDRDLPGFPVQQSGLLLSYLLINRQSPHHREPLAAVFWGDHPTEIARKYLRNTLWRLRQVFQSAGAPPDDYLSISEDCVTFINTSPCWIDVEEFEQTTTQFKNISGIDLNAGQAEKLSQAASLYTGDLLENVYEDWTLYERERMRLLYLNTLNKLMVFYGTNGAYEQGIEYGEKIMARDNTREKVHRQMMWLHWLAGNRDAALIQYRRCIQILHDELNVQPMEETRRLYEQIRSGLAPARNITDIPPAPAPTSRNSDLVLKPLFQQTLLRLYQLQQLLEETRSELNQIERKIDEALYNSSS